MHIENGCLIRYFGFETEVEIPKEVRTIKTKAFENSLELKKVMIHDQVKEIESGAFFKCENLKDIQLPNGITTIHEHTFAFCTSLKNIIIPDSVETIGISAFANCEKLEQIIMGSNVKTIKANAFEYCMNLDHMIIPSSVTSLDFSAFNLCTNLNTLIIPTHIARSLIKNKKRLNQFTYTTKNIFVFHQDFLKDVKSLHDLNMYATLYRYPLASNSDHPIKTYLYFMNKDDFDITNAEQVSLTIQNDCIVVNHTLNRYFGKEIRYTIDEKITEIDAYAFKNNKILQQVICPTKLKTIGFGAFENCRYLNTIVFNDQLEKIDQWAFALCNYLNNYTINNHVQVHPYAFA